MKKWRYIRRVTGKEFQVTFLLFLLLGIYAFKGYSEKEQKVEQANDQVDLIDNKVLKSK